MGSQDLFERILTSLQAGVLDDAMWPATSALIDRFCGTRGNYLVLCDGAEHEATDFIYARFCFGGRRHIELEREYFGFYHAMDERLPRIRRLPDGQLTPADSLFTEDELNTSLVYNQLLDRIDTRDGLTVRLDGPDGAHIVWATADPTQGNGWSSAQIGAIQSLLPHLRQFMLVRQALVSASAVGNSFVGLLDTVGMGVMLLDRTARVTATNDRARALLRRGDGVSDPDGVLHALLPEQDTQLQRLLAQALPASGGCGAGGSMLLSRTSTPVPLVLHVNPVSEAVSQRHGSGIGVLVLLVDAADRADIGERRVAALLGLTSAQSRVAVSLAQGKTIREIAEETGRSPTTIRWHLRQIFARLGVSRQVELVRLVTSLPDIPAQH